MLKAFKDALVETLTEDVHMPFWLFLPYAVCAGVGSWVIGCVTIACYRLYKDKAREEEEEEEP